MRSAPDRLRATVEHLATIDRPSASAGEREAAEWIAARLRELGREARVEAERAVGSFCPTLGGLSAAAAVAGLGERRGVAALVGALAAAGIYDDVSGGRQLVRRAVPHRTTFNVVAEAGDPHGQRTLVFAAHHDAARGGLVFRPELLTWPARAFPAWYERQQTSAQIMRVVVGGPALVALGAATGVGALQRAGAAVAALAALAFADIATRDVVPGANDNLSSVAALLDLARGLADAPPRGLRVLLLSTGSEESFMEGMRGFVARHRAEMDPARTTVVVLESLGSPELILLEGEGMVHMNDYDQRVRDALAAAAADAGEPLRRGLRSGLATDALIAHRAGLPTATLASVDRYKMAANYHTQRDLPHRVDYETVAAAVRVCEALISRCAAAPGPA
jgi:Peptidase family M28